MLARVATNHPRSNHTARRDTYQASRPRLSARGSVAARQVEYRILGPVEVVERGRVVPLGGSRQRALLALLLTRANEVVSADRLIDELWPAEPPQNAANALQY